MEHLFEGISQKIKILEEHLEAATKSIPSNILNESGLKEKILMCKNYGYNDLWMQHLQNIGKWLEGTERDDELSKYFWEHLMISAMLMNYYEFIPYMKGKMKGKPKKNWYDVIASVVVIGLSSQKNWLQGKMELKENIENYIGFLTTLNEDYPLLFNNKNLNDKQLSDRFRKDKLFEGGISEENSTKIDHMFVRLFYELFSAINEKTFPAELYEVSWAIINVNTFIVKLSDGPLPLTSHAAVYWDN